MATIPRRLAVDVGATALRGIELGPDAKGRPCLLAAAQVVFSQDQGKNEEKFPQLLQGLKELGASLSPKKQNTSLCLGGAAVFSRVIKIPMSDPAKMDSMVQFEAQQTVPAIEQAVWDYQSLPTAAPGEAEIFLLAIKKESVDEAVAAAAGSSFLVDRVDLVPAALLNVFRYMYPEVEGTVLLLDIGARASTILLLDSSRVFARVVPLGGAAITQAVATDLQESIAGAETLKLAKGFVHPGGAYADPEDAAAARISKLARGVMTRLHTEIERSITFFRSQQGGERPRQVYLSGGGALMGFVDLFFQEKLRAPVQFLQPFRRLSLGSGVSLGAFVKTFPAWAVAVGTALGGLPHCPCRINVMSAAGRSRAAQLRDRPAQMAALGAALFLFCLPGMHGFWQAEKIKSQLRSKTGEVEEAEAALTQLETKAKQLQILTGTLEKSTQFQEQRSRWLWLLENLQAKAPDGLWITQLLPLESTASTSAGGYELDISGMFETRSAEADARAVEEFVKALNQGGVLEKVEVVEREAPNYVEGKTEQVALRFRLKAIWPGHPLWPVPPATAKSAKDR